MVSTCGIARIPEKIGQAIVVEEEGVAPERMTPAGLVSWQIAGER